jgi:hypothetical protein
VHVGIPILRDWRRQAAPNAHGFEPFQGIFFVQREVKRRAGLLSSQCCG